MFLNQEIKSSQRGLSSANLYRIKIRLQSKQSFKILSLRTPVKIDLRK